MDTTTMQAKMDAMTRSIHKKMEEFEAKLQKSPSTPATISSLAAEFSSYRDVVTEALKFLQQQINTLAVSLDQMEMQRRRKILLLHGIPEKKDEDATVTVAQVCSKHLGVTDFTASDIKRCHRMGGMSSTKKPRPILFKLHDLGIRNKLWFDKTKLRGSGITMSEFLTKSRHDVFMAARAKFGINKTWTRDGAVYILGPDEKRHRVASLEELSNIDSHPLKKTGAPKVTATKSKRLAAVAKK